MREGVLERDRFRCRACGQQRRLLVHHRYPRNEPKLLVTLCTRCHVRIHRSLGVRYWLSGLLLKLWRELHQHEPVQLPLAFRPVAKRERSERGFEQARSAALALFSQTAQSEKYAWQEGFVLQRGVNQGSGSLL
jgi:hypothetical protein